MDAVLRIRLQGSACRGLCVLVVGLAFWGLGFRVSGCSCFVCLLGVNVRRFGSTFRCKE